MIRWIPRDLESFFYSSINGFELLLSVNRKKNKQLIIRVFNCLLQEKSFTDKDIEHLKNFKLLTDLIVIPEFKDAKRLISVQEYLRQCQQLPQNGGYRYLLEYLFFLLCRHGEIAANLQDARTELHLWELAHQFELSEHGIITDYIHWLEDRGFSKRSMLDSLGELRKFYSWLELSGLTFEQVNNDRLKAYLIARALKQKAGSKQRILSNIKPFLSFYKEVMNPAFPLPSITIQVQRDKIPYAQLSNQNILTITEAIKHENKQYNAALMLCLLTGYGVPLKCLPLVKLENNSLTYIYRCQARIGEKSIRIPVKQGTILDHLISGYRREPNLTYLLQSKVSKRTHKPVSVAHCQAIIQRYISGILGFEIPAQQVYRDCLKNRARHKLLPQFIDHTVLYPFTVGTKLYYWLSRLAVNHG